jgi:hypothetical protein
MMLMIRWASPSPQRASSRVRGTARLLARAAPFNPLRLPYGAIPMKFEPHHFDLLLLGLAAMIFGIGSFVIFF